MSTCPVGTFAIQSGGRGICFRALVPCLLALLIGLLGGCARHQTLPQETAAPSAPPAPPPGGMRLGAFYVSALNEPCYEAFAADGSSARPRAYCQRAGSWELLPDIYMVPSGGFPGKI